MAAKKTTSGVRDIRKAVTAEFRKHLGTTVLDESGREVFGAVFDITVGHFAKKAMRQNPPFHVWESAKFRSFILGQTKKIALEANRNSKNGIITATIFNRAARKVMTKTQKFCVVAIKQGRIEGLRKGHYASGHSTGEVCSTYLATVP